MSVVLGGGVCCVPDALRRGQTPAPDSLENSLPVAAVVGMILVGELVSEW